MQGAVLIGGELIHEHLRHVRGIAGVELLVLDIGDTLVEYLFGYAQRATEIKGIEGLYLAHDEHHVVGRLVVDKQLAITIVDDTACGIEHLPEKGVIVRRGLVITVYKLQKSEPHDVDEQHKDDGADDDESPVFVSVFLKVLHFDVPYGRLQSQRGKA